MSRPAHNILGSLPVPKLVWTMSAPIMLSMLMSAIYNLVDSIYVAQVSELDFLALSYAYPVQLMMVAFCAGTGVGFNALFAQRLGAGQKEEANRVACHGFLFYGLCWLLFLAFALLGAPLFFRLSTDNAAVAAAGTSYLVICCGLSIGMCMQFLTERLLQTTGHPAGFMIVQGSGAILNIILDPVFIFGLDMGVVGAAAATVIGQISGACIGFFLLWRIRGEFSVSFRGFRPDWKIVGNIYAIGLPSVVMVAIGSVMTFCMNKILITYHSAKETAATAFGIYFKLNSFVFMPVFGLNNGVVPIVAYNYGAQNRRRMMETIKRSAIYASCIMVLGMAIFWAIPGTLVSIFNATETMKQVAVPALRIISLSFLFAGFAIVCSSVFQALGNGVYSLIISVARQLVCILPLAWFFARTFGLHAVWLSLPLAEITSVVLSSILFRKIYLDKIKPLGQAAA